uniref:Uncharacterized protein n=1 Tax=Ceratitis capitata TaxID=7213 RepID=W8C2N4_CERCA
MSRNYTSPYAKPVQQYKSQTDDYISLEVGGPGKCSTPARAYYNNSNPKSGNGNFYQNKHRGRGFYQNRFSGGWSNNRHSNGGYGGQWQQQTPRSGNAAERQWRGGGQRQQNNRQTFNNQNNITAYVHSSMIEDPWKDLIERREAIRRSEINLSTTADQNEEVLSDSLSRDDSENDDESAEDKNKVVSGNT